MTEPVAYAIERIRTAIQQAPIAELAVAVSVDAAGRIRLEGPVATAAQREAVLATTRRLAPTATLVDDLSVDDANVAPTVEELP